MNFVAAALTIIGYSINNTIVIFDRIRRTCGLKRSETYAEVVNLSLLQSLRRCLNTSVSTVLAVLVLYLFGSPAIRDFMLALLIGLTVGTYSSAFWPPRSGQSGKPPRRTRGARPTGDGKRISL